MPVFDVDRVELNIKNEDKKVEVFYPVQLTLMNSACLNLQIKFDHNLGQPNFKVYLKNYEVKKYIDKGEKFYIGMVVEDNAQNFHMGNIRFDMVLSYTDVVGNAYKQIFDFSARGEVAYPLFKKGPLRV